MPTERGLALFGVLKRADPTLMDPGVTAELECLLDDVLIGRQEMTGAIDAVCDSARRIIGRLGERGADGEDVILGKADVSGGDRPPTAKMGKFAASIAKNKGIKPPAGYTKSAALCRAFLDEHAPRRDTGQGEATNSGGGRADAGLRGGKSGKTGEARPGTERPKAAGSGRATRPEAVRTEPSASAARTSAGSPDAASDSLREQGGGVQHGRPLRGGWLVRAAPVWISIVKRLRVPDCAAAPARRCRAPPAHLHQARPLPAGGSGAGGDGACRRFGGAAV